MIKYLIIIVLFFSCEKNDVFKILDGNSKWVIEEVIFKDKKTDSINKSNIALGHYLYISSKYNKVAIELYNKKQIVGNFIINYNKKSKDSFIISNSKNTIFNGEYYIKLDTIHRSLFSTHHRLLLESNKIIFRAKKIVAESPSH